MEEVKYYGTKGLAAALNLSVKWVEKWRHCIVGATRIGRVWRFDRRIIDKRLVQGLDVRNVPKSTLPHGRKYIVSVHGAARGGIKEGRDAHGAKKGRP